MHLRLDSEIEGSRSGCSWGRGRGRGRESERDGDDADCETKTLRSVPRNEARERVFIWHERSRRCDKEN